MLKGCSTLNKKRLFRAEYKNDDINKKRRKVLRGRKMKKKDKNFVKEGEVYEPGGF